MLSIAPDRTPFSIAPQWPRASHSGSSAPDNGRGSEVTRSKPTRTTRVGGAYSRCAELDAKSVSDTIRLRHAIDRRMRNVDEPQFQSSHGIRAAVHCFREQRRRPVTAWCVARVSYCDNRLRNTLCGAPLGIVDHPNTYSHFHSSFYHPKRIYMTRRCPTARHRRSTCDSRVNSGH